MSHQHFFSTVLEDKDCTFAYICYRLTFYGSPDLHSRKKEKEKKMYGGEEKKKKKT